MAVEVRCSSTGVQVHLTRLDRLLCGRRGVQAHHRQIGSQRIVSRGELEAAIDHRVVGWGPHDGGRRPGRRRVGVMLGRGVVGRQFWAVPAGPSDEPLAAISLHDHEFVRLVVPAADLEATGPG